MGNLGPSILATLRNQPIARIVRANILPISKEDTDASD